MPALLKRRGSRKNGIKIFYATDLHGSTMTWRKFVNAAKFYDVDALVCGGDLMGKIVVPDSILKKPGKLTPEEYAIVKQHCYSGGQICKRVGFLMDAYPIVYHHHERWDGKGYPDGIKGDRIPLGARIVSVVDAYDAMTTDRPYRDALPLPEVWAVLRDGAGRQWDARIVETFIETVNDHGDPERGLQGHSHVDELVLPGQPGFDRR